MQLSPGPGPTIVGYNASGVKIYYATSILVRFNNEIEKMLYRTTTLAL
jgi:hypothetical protein